MSHNFLNIRRSEHTLVWRGVREGLSALYPKGKICVWWAFSSCTTSMGVLEAAHYLGKSGTRTIFSIRTNSGKLIRAHSSSENDDEILLPPGICLKVIDSVISADGLHIVHLQEISPPFQTLQEPFDHNHLKQAVPQSKLSTHSSKPAVKRENHSKVNPMPMLLEEVSLKKGKFKETDYGFSLDLEEDQKELGSFSL